MSFVAMFAVTGMMGDYMKPIPVFASIALIASMFVAFSINPFIAGLLYNKKTAHAHAEKDSKFLNWYGKFIGKFIVNDPKVERTRRLFKIGFWLALFAIIISPIMLNIFKARMLPKADKNQVYLWIDAPRDTEVAKMLEISEDASNFLLCKNQKESDAKLSVPESLCLAESTSTSIGDRFLSDFANLFRGGSNRVQEQQISMRINIEESKHRDMKSEEYAIKIRPLLRAHLLEKYPDLRLRLLEDPPGPPTLATFHIKAKGQEDLSPAELTRFASSIKKTVESIAREESLVDITDSLSSPYRQLRITLNHDRIAETGLSFPQVSGTIMAFLNPSPVSILHTETTQKENNNIIVGFPRSEREDISALQSLVFMSPK